MINYTRGFASEQAVVSSTALNLDTFGFTAAEMQEATRAIVMVNTNAIRVWWDGSTPTTTDGMIFAVGFELIGVNVQQLLIVRDGTSDAEIAITLEK